MAQALLGLKSERAFVVHGSDGLDEVTTTGPTAVFEVTREGVRKLEWIPSDFGVEQASSSHLAGGDKVVNCRIATAILHGERGAQRDIVLVNAAAALLAAGVVADLREAMLLAEESVNSGAARKKVEHLASFTTAHERETRNEKRETGI
jgi:anthranilate phosphoribosyltransferase